jgi:hypothetical protein
LRKEVIVSDEPQALSAGDFLLSVIDGGLSKLARRPLKVRAKVSVGNAARGRFDVLLLELGDVQADKLQIHRLILRAEDAHLTLGIRPRLRATNVGVKVTVLQDAIDAWTKASRIPARLRLAENGVVATTEIFGQTVSEVEVVLGVEDSTLVMRPVRAAFLRQRAPVPWSVSWPVPLRFPKQTSLADVEHHPGSVTLYLRLPDVDKSLPAVVASELARRVGPQLLSLGVAAARSAARRRL